MQLAFKENTEIFCIFIFSLFVLKHIPMLTSKAGVDPGFQVRGGALKKIGPSGGRREHFWGISCEKSRFCAKKSYFFQF